MDDRTISGAARPPDIPGMGSPRRRHLARLTLAGFVFAGTLGVAPAAPWIAPAAAAPVDDPGTALIAPGEGPIAAASGWTCPVEDRSTRPNNGGAAVSSFAVRGFDLSHWDGVAGVTLRSVKNWGARFVFVKATQGTYRIDDYYARQVSAAKQLGLRVGAYHFFDYRIDGKAQADYFVAAVRARGGFHGQLPPVLDVECVPYGPPTPSASVSRIRAFVNEVYRLVGVKPIIYTSIFEWQTVTGGSAAFGDTKLWSAEWAPTAPRRFPPGWTSWLFWQWGFARVGNPAHTVDADVFNGTATQLDRLRLP